MICVSPFFYATYVFPPAAFTFFISPIRLHANTAYLRITKSGDRAFYVDSCISIEVRLRNRTANRKTPAAVTLMSLALN